MKALFFDCCSGIDGDMILGALLDLGVSENLFRRELGKLNLPGYRLIIKKLQKNGIHGTSVTVVPDCMPGHIMIDGEKIEGNKELEDGDDCCLSWHNGTYCSIPNIKQLINRSSLGESVKDFSIRVFGEITRAEAKALGKSIDEVSFRKEKTIESIIHIVGTKICIDLLGINKVFSSPLYDGKGYIKSNNGIISVPSPTVVEMLFGTVIPLITLNINMELVTPTGVSLIKCMASDFGNMPAMIIDRVGYGMGKREIGEPDALRVILGDLLEEKIIEEEYEMDELVSSEIGIDGKCPEIPDYAV